MGIYDRGYYQDESSSFSFSGRQMGSVVKTLILINVAVFLLDQFTPVTSRHGDTYHWLSDFLALKSDLFQKPWNFWQLLTAGFAHAPLDGSRFIWHILGNMFALWVFGSALERHYGSREFLRLYLALIVLSNLVWVIAQNLMGNTAQIYGASGGVSGLIVLFALLFPKEKLYLIPFPVAIPAWLLGVLVVGGDMMGAASRDPENRVAFVAHLAGAGLAFLYHQSGIRLESFFSGGFKLPKLGRPKLKVHRPNTKQGDIDRRADEILKKVHRDGADSITAEERKILDDYSRRMRQKLR
jgi:membrane associated rhomboid family serine protease